MKHRILSVMMLMSTLCGSGFNGLPASSEPNWVEQIRQVLGTSIVSVEESDRRKMGILAQSGNYVAKTKDGREIGIFLQEKVWDLTESPFFWLIEKTPEQNAVVLTPTRQGFQVERIPSDWLISTYIEQRHPNREASFPTGNAPRQLSQRSGGFLYIASTEFVADRSFMKNGLAVAYFWIDPKTMKVNFFTQGVNYTKGEMEANTWIVKLQKLLLLPPSMTIYSNRLNKNNVNK